MPPRDISEEVGAAPILSPSSPLDADPFVPPKLNLGEIRKSLPSHVFEKDLIRSLYYFIIDVTVIAACLRFYSPTLSWPVYILYSNILGLFMWCLFVVGHDCGHGTFSDNKVINGVFGHLSHGFLLVPFWPWARSHAAHHAFHQHKEKDRGHVWSTESDGYNAFFRDTPFMIPVIYGIGYLLLEYRCSWLFNAFQKRNQQHTFVYGYADGSHYFPWSKLHKTNRDRLDCTISALVCIAFLAILYTSLGSNFWAAYFVPWLIYNTWLYAVTYLQHHTEGTKVYGDGSWSFTAGALETVDRVYDTVTDGTLDAVMHNITDGHVVHHLFSTSIPHYNLIDATNVIRPQLGDEYKMVRAFPPR
ncbi:fatty acid desaturase-domain-containing protein [Chytridium lagenaria]|nr:fatty acid desaturase-domain-containing protein [Chytridium lagenaria]